MLLFENEGFIEVETSEILRLSRSDQEVSFGDAESGRYSLSAVLCDYQDGAEQRCRTAFYDKNLKRALVFTVAGTGKKPLWQEGQELLTELGFQLNSVNLRLSPAMLEVVLRDVPGMASPAAARKKRAAHQALVEGYQTAISDSPESPQGKKAALKLDAEKRQNERVEGLRLLLEELLLPEENGNRDLEALLHQVKDLTARLTAAEAAADAARSEKEMSESITAAAEKRIQELEELLVAVETQSSDVIKHKQKLVKLKSQIKALKADLQVAAAELTTEQEKQLQFVEDVKSANAQIVALQQELKDATAMHESALADLSRRDVEVVQLDERCSAAELRTKTLERDLKEASARAEQLDETVKSTEELRCRLLDVEKELKDAVELNQRLEEDLAVATEQCKDLQGAEEEKRAAGQHIETLEQKLEAAEQEIVKGAAGVELAEELQARLKALERELEDTAAQNKILQADLSVAAEESEKLQGRLLDAEKAGEDKLTAQGELQSLVEMHAQLDEERTALQAECERERTLRLRLEGCAVEDRRRLADLEQALAKASAAQPAAVSDAVSSGIDQDLVDELKALQQSCEEERVTRERVENELSEAQNIIDSLEKMVRERDLSAKSSRQQQGGTEQASGKILALEAQLQSLQKQLEGETLIKKGLAKELVAAEKKLAEQELAQLEAVAREGALSATLAPSGGVKKLNGSKPLPHELRPAPKKGAFFRPDWDLQGLPCTSTEQILKAWETVFNVQIGIEGYPAQYCMAYMVLLRRGKQKQLFIVYRLKQNNHTLVTVPSKKPKNEASLQLAIATGLDYLRKSGFEMDEMSAEHIESALGSYCLGTDK